MHLHRGGQEREYLEAKIDASTQFTVDPGDVPGVSFLSVIKGFVEWLVRGALFTVPKRVISINNQFHNVGINH